MKDDYFVLLSYIDTTPKKLLSEYFGRAAIEPVVKTSKEYLGLLPFAMWTDETVRRKSLLDVMNTIVLLLLRKNLRHRVHCYGSVWKNTPQMCRRNTETGIITVEMPNTYVKKYYKMLELDVPARVKEKVFMKQVLKL